MRNNKHLLVLSGDKTKIGGDSQIKGASLKRKMKNKAKPQEKKTRDVPFSI